MTSSTKLCIEHREGEEEARGNREGRRQWHQRRRRGHLRPQGDLHRGAVIRGCPAKAARLLSTRDASSYVPPYAHPAPLPSFSSTASSIRTSPICSPPKVGETRFLSLCHTNFPLRPLCNFASVSFCFLSKSIYTCTTERTIHDGFIYEWGPKRMKPGPKEKKAYMPFVSPYCLALFPVPLLLTDIGGSLMNFRGFFFHVLFFSSICHGFLTLYRGQNKSLFFGHLWEGDRSLETEEQQSWGVFLSFFFFGFLLQKDEKREMI